MMKRNNRAFTLIELLAVIVILAIIAVIATPIILRVIENVKKEAFRNTAYGIIDAAENYYMRETLKGRDITQETFEYPNDNRLEFRGTKPSNGTVNLNNKGKVELAISDGKWCARKDYEESKVTINDVSLDDCSTSVIASESCFDFDPETGTILEYYEHEDNDENKPMCPLSLIIPDEIDNTPVLEIGDSAFYRPTLTQYCYTYDEETGIYGRDVNVGLDYVHTPDDGYYECYEWDGPDYIKGIRSVKIPNTVNSIGDYAFAYNQLTSLDLSNLENLTTIGYWAFSDNQLTSLDLSNLENLTNIGSYAFSNNQLISLDLSNLENLTTIEEYAFYYNQLTNLNLSNLENLTTIGDGAFFYNQLTNVVLPTNVEYIDYFAFANNQIESINLSDLTNVSIGGGAFNNNRLSEEQAYICYNVSCENSNSTIVSYGGINKNNFKIPENIAANITTIGESAFSHNQLTSLDLSNLENLTTIGWGAFECNQLTNLNLSNLENLTTIEEYAFYYNQLTNLNLSNLENLTTIGDYAFAYNQLTSLNLSNLENLTTIGWGAFEYNQLTSVIIPSNVNINSNAISSTFYTAYVTNNNRAGGTYTAESQEGTWTKQS